MMSSDKDSLSHANQYIVKLALNDSWAEFYDWQQGYCTHLLTRLYTTSCIGTVPFGRPWDGVLAANVDVDKDTELLPLTYFDIWDYETQSCTVSQEVLTVPQSDSFMPISPYESFPLTDRNVHRGDEAELLSFMPYSDDPNFDYLDFLDGQYTKDAFEWKTMKDPNLQIIFLHAVWQLHEHHGLSFKEIDATRIIPERLLSGDDKRFEPGLLAISARRNFLPWPNLKLPPYNDIYALRRLGTQVKDMVGIFCNNLNCLLGLCPTHIVPSAEPGQTPAKYPSHDFFTLYEPCGENCFRFSDADDNKQDIRWDANETLVLELCLRVFPDAAPCNLALSCHQPCREVFARRRHIVPDSNIPAPSKRPKRKQCKDIIHDWQTWAANSPCSHIGVSCENAGDACPCIANDALCQAACRCGPFPCGRQRKGCRCKKQDCQDPKKCRCAGAGRECDPAICRTCGIHGISIDNVHPRQPAHIRIDIVSGRCANGPIQRGIWKSLEVKECPWGRGAFSLEYIRRGEFISEYIGEILFAPTADTREKLANHRGRNYLFSLERGHTIDSAFVGNETRYINHSTDNANCDAFILFVNGEHRIGFWTTKDIAQGDEILFDYGEKFLLNSEDAIIVVD